MSRKSRKNEAFDLPSFQMIRAASNGDIEAINAVLKHYEGYIAALQVCLDSGAKRVLLPITSAAELGTVPADLIGSFNLIFYSSAEDAVFKALGVE
nr:helix-turn-helix domain-containing protein [Dorea formicigenerans]